MEAVAAKLCFNSQAMLPHYEKWKNRLKQVILWKDFWSNMAEIFSCYRDPERWISLYVSTSLPKIPK